MVSLSSSGKLALDKLVVRRLLQQRDLHNTPDSHGVVSMYRDRLGSLKRNSSLLSLVEYPPSMTKRYTSIVAGSIQSTILRAARSIRTAFSGYAVKQN